MSNIDLTCKGCGNIFTTEYKFRDKLYCNRECYFKDNNSKVGTKDREKYYEDRNCIVCDTTFNVRKKVKKTMCSDDCRVIHNKLNKEKRIEVSKSSCLNKYGVEFSLQLKDVRDRGLLTIKNKYNVNHPMHSDLIKEKMRETYKSKRIEKFNIRSSDNNFDLVEVIKPELVKLSCKKCNTITTFTQMKNNKNPICRNCFPITKNSTLNEKFDEFINFLNYKKNDRTVIKPQEIDFLLLDKKYGFEINGNYWHSEYYGGKDKEYHIDKTTKAHSVDVNLIHIFEDEVIDKFEIVKSRVLNKLNLNSNKIYARKCKIKEPSPTEEREFLNKTHIQGYIRSKHKLGLYHNNTLVSIMTFGTRKITRTKEMEIELLRFSNELDTVIVGGFSRLLRNFLKNTNYNKIITYSDIRWNGLAIDNSVYVKNGFNFVKQTPPNYWYVSIKNFKKRYHRFNFRKDILVNEGYDKSKTESEIMFELGYDKIWDCGSMKLEFVVTPTSVSFDNL
jgi:hypothetical protein